MVNWVPVAVHVSRGNDLPSHSIPDENTNGIPDRILDGCLSFATQTLNSNTPWHSDFFICLFSFLSFLFPSYFCKLYVQIHKRKKLWLFFKENEKKMSVKTFFVIVKKYLLSEALLFYDIYCKRQS